MSDTPTPDLPARDRPDPETYADWWEVKYSCYAVRYDKYLDIYDLYAAERTKLEAAEAEKLTLHEANEGLGSAAWAATERAEAAEAERDAALGALGECMKEIDDYIRHEYPGDHPVQERYRQRDFSANPARVFLQARPASYVAARQKRGE